jgi:hypothetical protein
VFSENYDFELMAIFFYCVFSKIAFNKHRTLKIDSATSTGNHGKYIFDSFGLRWRQRPTIEDLHEQCIATEDIDSTSTVLIPRTELFSSAPNLSFKVYRTRFPIQKDFAMIINKAQGSTL